MADEQVSLFPQVEASSAPTGAWPELERRLWDLRCVRRMRAGRVEGEPDTTTAEGAAICKPIIPLRTDS